MPVCVNVTKQQCDTKWVINEQGEKVWAGNENCHDVTWQDCTLQLREVEIEVPTYDCSPADNPILFQTVEHFHAEVTLLDRSCVPVAKPVCTVTTERKCGEVEWEDCEEIVMPDCQDVLFEVPYQEFNHLIRCPVSH